MALLKNSIINKIQNVIGSGDYCLDDFDVSFPDKGGVLFDVFFISYPSFTLRIYEEASNNMNAFSIISQREPNLKKIIKCSVSPGEYKNIETTVHDDLDSAISKIYSWSTNIRQELIELKSINNQQEKDEVLEGFKEYLNEPIDEPDSFFSKEEVQNLKEKLIQLQKRVEELEAKQKLSQSDKESLIEVIETTKSEIEIYPKGVWYRTAGNKFIRTLKSVFKNKESRDLVIDVIRKSLESCA